MRGDGYVVYVSATEKTVADGGTGSLADTAVIDDTFADDMLVAEFESARMFAFFYEHEIRGFETVLARDNSLPGGDDRQQIEETLDYVLETEGVWTDF